MSPAATRFTHESIYEPDLSNGKRKPLRRNVVKLSRDEIVEALEKEALEHRIRSLFAFTYVDGFFRKLGFEEVDRAELPLKAWRDCLRCPKFDNCDEIAVIRVLRPARYQARQQELPPVIGIDNGQVVLLPTVRR